MDNYRVKPTEQKSEWQQFLDIWNKRDRRLALRFANAMKDPLNKSTALNYLKKK